MGAPTTTIHQISKLKTVRGPYHGIFVSTRRLFRYNIYIYSETISSIQLQGEVTKRKVPFVKSESVVSACVSGLILSNTNYNDVIAEAPIIDSNVSLLLFINVGRLRTTTTAARFISSITTISTTTIDSTTEKEVSSSVSVVSNNSIIDF